MLYDDFYVKDSKSNFINECNALDNHEKTHKGVKELCMKLVSSLDKLSKMETKSQERKDRCDYLPYWLYDEIGKIYKKNTSKRNNTQPVKKQISGGKKKNKKKIKKNKCTTKTQNHNNREEEKKKKKYYNNYKKKNKQSSNDNRPKNNKKSKQNKKHKNIEKCQVSRSSSGGGGGFLGSWLGGSSSRGSTASQAGETRQKQASATAGKAGPQAQETRAGNVGSTQDAKLAAVPRESKATPINMERQPIPEKQSRHSIEQNQQVQLQHVPNSYTGLDTLPDGSSGSSDFLKSTHEILKSEYFRHAVVGASIIGVLIFLFYFFKVQFWF
ncbi:hypothetical protein PVNG_06254 [Plasmodium vivax North Korean]|uniref:VIR protein n=1 Tax=Plasmodium vivax North Korean TaxID=1035514 RepID=A0A0J9TMP1_PLAVI|nr:hypothetical protein PVNG_06254 [Plasmodium vivax North Korean]